MKEIPPSALKRVEVYSVVRRGEEQDPERWTYTDEKGGRFNIFFGIRVYDDDSGINGKGEYYTRVVDGLDELNAMLSAIFTTGLSTK